jgi:hypothetical protein
MDRMLLLLLGIAINGDLKEAYIDQIQQRLDTELQVKLVPYLRLVNDDINFSISNSLHIELGGNETQVPPRVVDQLVSSTLSDVFATSSQHQPDGNNVQLSTVSSTTSFVAKCQQLVQSVSESIGNPSTTVLTYQSLDEVNYFLNQRLIPNIQRIVEERDSYMETIVELKQDKDLLNYQLSKAGVNTSSTIAHAHHLTSANSVISMNGQSAVAVGGVDSTSWGGGFDDKQFLHEAVKKICSGGHDGDVEPSNSLVNLSDTQTIMMLFDSILKEFAVTNSSLADSRLGADEFDSFNGTTETVTGNGNISASGAKNAFMNDSKNRKILTNNFNPKIASELFKCNMKLQQLKNEM